MAMTAQLEFTNLQNKKSEDAASRNLPRRRNRQHLPLIALNKHTTTH